MVNLAINLPRGKVVLTSSWRRACQEHWLKCRVEKPRAMDSRVEYWDGRAKVSGAQFKVAENIPLQKSRFILIRKTNWDFSKWNAISFETFNSVRSKYSSGGSMNQSKRDKYLLESLNYCISHVFIFLNILVKLNG